MVSGFPSAVLSQSTIPVNSGAGPQSASTAGSFSHSSKDIWTCCGGVDDLRLGVQRSQGVAGGVVVLESLLDRGHVARDRPLDGVGQAEGHRQARREEHSPRHTAHCRHPIGQPPTHVAAEPGDEQQRDRQPCGEGQRQDDQAPGQALRGRQDGDRGEHRTGAGHEHDAEREAEDIRGTAADRTPVGDAPEQLLQPVPDAGDQQPQPDADQDDQRQRAQQAVGHAEGRDEGGSQERQEGEGREQPRHDQVGPTPAGSCGPDDRQRCSCLHRPRARRLGAPVPHLRSARRPPGSPAGPAARRGTGR